MKKFVVFSGSGISKDSGIPTFRDSNDGLYLNKKIEDAFSVEGWKKDKKFILDIHNEMRSKIKELQPNEGHLLIKKLEQHYDVTVITQNIDFLHELAGSSNVLHLHGEILKSRSTLDNKIFDCNEDINLGDKCPRGSQLRPHTVLFGEMPYSVDEAYQALQEADILIVVGTSLSIGYTIPLLGSTQAKEVYFINPEKITDLDRYPFKVKYIKKSSTEGLKSLVKKLTKF